MSETPSAPEECAQCGAPIPPRARACPDCGADERTGWREASIYDGLDLPPAAGDEESAPEKRGLFPAWVRLLFVFVLIVLTVILLIRG